MLIFITGEDDNSNALYIDGKLVYYGQDDYLDSETVFNLVGLGLIDPKLTADGAQHGYLTNEQADNAVEGGYPNTLEELYALVPADQLDLKNFDPVAPVN